MSKRRVFGHKKRKYTPKKVCVKKKNKTAIVEDPFAGKTLIEMLSDDCLAKIFTYLPIKKRLEMEKVCMRWRDVSQQTWHDIKILDLRKNRIKRQAEAEQLLARCGLYLTHLNISSSCDSSILPVVRQHCDNLTKLELELKKYSDAHFVGAFANMEKLRHIKIKNTYGQYLFRCLQSLCEEMEEIHLGLLHARNCPGYLYNPLPQNSLARFNSLRYLSINAHALDRNEIKVISQKQTLIHLNLAFCKLNKEDTCLISNLVNLEHLDFRGVDAVYDNVLLSLVNKCKRLKYLDISLCTSITDRGLCELANLRNLEELLINDMRRNVTDDPFEFQFNQLKVLECKSCKYIGDSGIIGLLRNSENLERLCLTRTSITTDTLFCAANITRSRKNNIILYLSADLWVAQEFDAMENLSPFLVIETI